MDRTKPPLTPDLPVYKLPPVFETTLPNGLAVLLVEDRRFPMITARLGFEAGSKFDAPELPGLSESTAALLTEGTARRSARETAEEAAAMGGSIQGDSSSDSMIVSANALAENLPRLLELMADVARNATFPDEEVKLRKQNRLQELIAQRSDASFLADEKFSEVVFSPHPYARQDPTLESIPKLSRAACVHFRNHHLSPKGAVLVVLGALPSRERVRDLIGEHFGDWSGGDAVPVPAPVFAAARKIVLVDRPGSVQADIRIGGLAVVRTHPDYFPLLVGNTVLGGGTSSRIFTNIREKKGFAYDAHSMVAPLKDAGSFEIVTQVRNEVLQPAIEALLEEARQIGSTCVSEDELSTAKNYLSGVFVIRLETQDGLASQLLAVRLLGLPLDYLERYTSRVRAVTPDQIRAAASRHVDPKAASIVVVGDAGMIRQQLETFGPIQVETAE